MTTKSDDNSEKSGTEPDPPGLTNHSAKTIGLDDQDTRQLELSGQEIGDYLVIDELGAGGGGLVYKAQHRRMERIVALKVLRRMHNTSVVLRFHREVKAAAKLLHPNIVTAFDAGEFDQLHYLVMEFVDGPSLATLVKEEGPISPVLAMDYICQAAVGLEYAHSRNVVHRDIKPSNMIVDQEGTLKVLDMGLARFQDSDEAAEAGLTQVGIIMGTVHYMSPEQASNATTVDYRTDIYSLGCTLFYLLTGQPVYSGTMIETVMAHARQPIPRLSDHCENVPPALELIYLKMMAKRREDRWQSMTEIVAELKKLNELTLAGNTTSRLEEMLRKVPAVSGESNISNVLTVDLGSAASMMGCLDSQGQAVILQSRSGGVVTPTAVIVEPDRIAAGDEAVKAFNLKANAVACDLKQELAAEVYPRPLSKQEFPASVLLSLVLKHMIDDARGQVPEPHHLALTTPGCFGDLRRHALQCCASIASGRLVDLVNDSTAIAATFLTTKQMVSPSIGRNLLIYRLGAGSFDATVIRAEGAKLVTTSIAGDPRLGCDRMDEQVMNFMARQFTAEYGIDPSQNFASMARLRRECAQVRERLSEKEQAPVQCRFEGKVVRGGLSRESFARLIKDQIDTTKTLTMEALEGAMLGVDEMDHVIIAGGGSRMPIVAGMLGEMFPCEVDRSMLADDATILGATLLAARHRTDAPTPWEVHEVNPASIEVVGLDRKTGKKQSSTVVPRNARLPTARRLAFRTNKDNQAAVAIQLVQGDAASLSDYTKVGSCQVTLPSELPAGTPLWLEFHVNESGRLSVFAELPDQEELVPVMIERSTTLNDEQIGQWRNWLETTLLTM